MQVGIEDCLHIEFEYNKSKFVACCVVPFSCRVALSISHRPNACTEPTAQFLSIHPCFQPRRTTSKIFSTCWSKHPSPTSISLIQIPSQRHCHRQNFLPPGIPCSSCEKCTCTGLISVQFISIAWDGLGHRCASKSSTWSWPLSSANRLGK